MSTLPTADPRPPSERAPRPMGGLPLIGTVAAVLVGAVSALLLALGAPGTIDDRDPRTLPPCAVEDVSTGPVPCFWDASEQGNGRGRSFVAWGRGDDEWAPLPAELSTP